MPAAQWNLVVEMLNLTKTNWLNKQAPGNNLQIEVQNLTYSFTALIHPIKQTLQVNVMLINDISQWPLFVQWWHTHWNCY